MINELCCPFWSMKDGKALGHTDSSSGGDHILGVSAEQTIAALFIPIFVPPVTILTYLGLRAL